MSKAVEPDPSEPDDFSDEQVPVADSAVQRVRVLAAEMRDKEVAVKAAESAVEAAKKELAAIRDGSLPDAIKEMGVNSLDVPGVGKVSWKPDVYGSLPSLEKSPQERAAALAWFLQNEPHIVKRKLTAMMPMEMPTSISEEQIYRVTCLLFEYALGKTPDISLNEVVEKIVGVLVPESEIATNMDIHPQTLMAWGREQIAEGKNHPYRTLGLVPVDRAKIEKPRGTKKAGNNTAREL